MSAGYNFNAVWFACRGWNQKYYTQDLCPVRHRLVEMVWRHNYIDNKMDHCYVVHPDKQRVAMAECGDKS